jgi:two-component system, NarL family, nitrate/nitrite response regulator NarL
MTIDQRLQGYEGGAAQVFGLGGAVTPFFYEILLVDDHALVRQGIRKIIEEQSGLRVVGELQDGLALLEFLQHTRPHLVILDISMPCLGGIDATRIVKTSYPEVKVLILTLHNRKEYVDQSRLAGVDGYVLKDEVDKELLSAIETLRRGCVYLSPLLENIVPDSCESSSGPTDLTG